MTPPRRVVTGWKGVAHTGPGMSPAGNSAPDRPSLIDVRFMDCVAPQRCELVRSSRRESQSHAMPWSATSRRSWFVRALTKIDLKVSDVTRRGPNSRTQLRGVSCVLWLTRQQRQVMTAADFGLIALLVLAMHATYAH